MNLNSIFTCYEPYIITLRRYFHQHPELSLNEKLTSQKIKCELDTLHIPYQELASGYGIVAVLQGTNSLSSKSIAARADIDALPINEDTNLPFSSSTPHVMHACGHDAHIAMLLGCARVLKELQHTLSGTVYFLFQPAEETGSGHEDILNYLKKQGGVDQVIGLHIWNQIPEGEILLYPGSVFAGGNWFRCSIEGQGGHGARPDLVADPIKALCALTLQLSSIPSNFYDVMDHCVISVGKIHAGTLANIFPSQAVLEGTTRYYKPGGDQKILHLIKQISSGIEQIYGVSIKSEYFRELLPVCNTPSYIYRASELVQYIDGLKLSSQNEPICASDNFCYLLNEYSGFYGILGGGKISAKNYPHHHPKFDIDECALKKGAQFMAQYILDYLS